VDIADTQREGRGEDVLRRDFTVNMLLRDLSTGKIVDPTGVSLSDLKEWDLTRAPSLKSIFKKLSMPIDSVVIIIIIIIIHCLLFSLFIIIL
jgi:hypothetical protein